jgi:hypothetical protein
LTEEPLILGNLTTGDFLLTTWTGGSISPGVQTGQSLDGSIVLNIVHIGGESWEIAKLVTVQKVLDDWDDVGIWLG